MEDYTAKWYGIAVSLEYLADPRNVLILDSFSSYMVSGQVSSFLLNELEKYDAPDKGYMLCIKAYHDGECVRCYYKKNP